MEEVDRKKGNKVQRTCDSRKHQALIELKQSQCNLSRGIMSRLVVNQGRVVGSDHITGPSNLLKR